MKNNKKFGIGIVGAGMIAHVHAKAISEIENATLKGVYSPTAKKRLDLASQHHCTAYESLESMLGNPEIDLVCICTPSGLHMDPTLKCIEAGKHCMVEKPLEITLEKCDAIIDAADKKGVKVGVIFHSRFYEASLQLKKAIVENKFGNIALGDAYIKWQRTEAYYTSNAWRGTWSIDGGGALMNQGIHSVDLLQWYMGPIESIQAFAGNVRHKSIEVEDTVVAALKFANGSMGTIECSTAVFPGDLKKIEILGTQGTAILQESNLIKWEFLEMTEDDMRIHQNIANNPVAIGGASNPGDISYVGHQRQLEDMLDSIANNRKPLVDAVEGRKSVAIVLGVYESARTGKMVDMKKWY